MNTLCPKCGVAPGQPHDDYCGIAVCRATGGQRLACDGMHEGHCGDDKWTGGVPAALDAIELGFYCRWVDRETGEPIHFELHRRGRWQACGEDDDGARPDLSRLHPPYAYWNAETGHWETP